MAITSIGVNDALAVKLWSKKLDHEAPKLTDIWRLIGDDPNSIIHRKVETSKSKGDQITYGLRMQLSGRGFGENDLAEGNGEALQLYSDSLLIGELGNLVSVKSKNSIDHQRVSFDLRNEAKGGLADWYAKRYSASFFNQVCGYTVASDVLYTGLNAVTAPSAGRIIRQNGVANDESLVAGMTFTLDLIDKAKEIAITASPMIRPANFTGTMSMGGRRDYNKTLTDTYVMYLHPFQITDLKSNTSSGNWQDLTKAAYMGAREGFPIFTGAIGAYNGVILRQTPDVTPGVSSADGTAVSTVRRAVLLGGQAVMMAFGMDNGPNKYRWHEELFDAARRLEVSAWTMHGMKKTRYNNTDYGTVVVSTYAAAHT